MLFLYRFVDLLFNILIFAIVGRALLSWFNLGPGNPIVRLLYEITEPILAPMRRVIPMIGMLDISPIVAILLLSFMQNLIVQAMVAYQPISEWS
ncbi:MAG TPA: YggT family protein [Chloroflexota bacterium]|nr:YggT family protein [Chloroflexota bacterium]